jgi:PKD repeat protein
MTNKKLILIGAAALSLVLLAVAAPSALSAPTAATLIASVQSQACQGGDNVNVTLTATLQPPQSNVRYTWDFNNDGIFDTAPSPNPTVTHRYPDEANVTAVVKVTKGTRSATDSITFSTVRCGG